MSHALIVSAIESPLLSVSRLSSPVWFQEKEDSTKLRAGQPIRLFHKEIEAYLVAEGLFDDEIVEDGSYSCCTSNRHHISLPKFNAMLSIAIHTRRYQQMQLIADS